MPELALTSEVWDAAFELARRCQAVGVTVPATDLLISACAAFHGAQVEHADTDFDHLRDLSRG